MGRRSNRILACWLSVLAAVALTACAEKSPEARVLEARSKYSLEPTGFLVRELEAEEPAAIGEKPVAVMGEEISVEASASEELAGGGTAEDATTDEEPAAPQGPRSVEVMFDLLVRFNAVGDALPGITVEVVHEDSLQQEKGRHLIWVETPGLRKGEERQVPVVLAIDDFEDGDEFSIDFREDVPPEKRGEYRELAEAAL